MTRLFSSFRTTFAGLFLSAAFTHRINISPSGAFAMSTASKSNSTPRTFLITGATDGIGRHTAKKIASDGHGLIVHGRKSRDEVKDLVSDLENRGAAFVHYLRCDLADLEQVKQLASDVEGVTDRLDVLVNNAGVFDPAKRFSAQGYETTWAVNVMAPFVLTRKLLPLLAKTGKGPRIITTSSISQSSSLPKDLNQAFGNEKGFSYSAHQAYSHSKLGDLMFTVKLAEILSSQKDPRLSNIKCLTMDPGTVNTKMLLAGWGPCGIEVSQADNTYKLAATGYGAEQPSGSYHFGWRSASDSKDPKKLEILWKELEKQTGCTYDDIATCI